MTSDVVLSGALRSNLLSLQKTQSQIDQTQQRLATGKKVNSALDNPQNFFAGQSLDNRASDLTRLLDGIGQSISTVKAADEGIKSMTSLVEQANSIATQALEASNASASGASITGDTDVSDKTFAAGDSVSFSFTDQNGEDITMDATNNGNFTAAAGDTIDDLVTAINGARDSDGNKVIEASVNDSGRLTVKTLNGANARVEVNAASGDTGDAQGLSGELGFGTIMQDANPSDATSGVATNLEASSSVRSDKLEVGGETAQRSDTLVDAGALTYASSDASDSLSINVGINGGAARAIDVEEDITVQGLVDKINGDAVLSKRVEASFDDETGRISIAPKDGSVDSVEFSATATTGDTTAETVSLDLGFGSGAAQSATTGTTNGDSATTGVESVRFGSGGGELAQLESDFNEVRAQIDTLVKDSGYRGTNLLNGDDLVTTFNEDRTSQLTTEGADFTSEGLGITEGAFGSKNNITESIDQVRNALNQVREFGGSIANDLNVIQTRQDFTESFVNNLEEGRDKLTVADQNEEGANLLALQTRQQLATTSLSLASQSQQSVLRLF